MITHYYQVIEKSGNKKLGKGVATSIHSKNTCPSTCILKEKGCYGIYGPMNFHWNQVSEGKRGTSNLSEHVENIKKASRKVKFFRHCQVGDLPDSLRDSLRILDAPECISWTYTHKIKNMNFLQGVNKSRTTVNLSLENLDDVENYVGEHLPITCIVKGQHKNWRKVKSSSGFPIVRCPAEYHEHITCSNCGNGLPLCARKDRTFGVGFTPHGIGKKSIS